MKKRIFYIFLIIVLIALISGLTAYYFSWRQARVNCFQETNRQANDLCEQLKNIQDKTAECISSGNLNCVDLANYKFFHYLLVKKERNEITDKLCQEVVAAPKSDVEEINFEDPKIFCDNLSELLLARDVSRCENLSENQLIKNYCRFVLTGDVNYCGDSLKCQDRSILFRSLLDNSYESCDQVVDINVRSACFFFKRVKETSSEKFSCQSIYGDQKWFLGNMASDVYCKSLQK